MPAVTKKGLIMSEADDLFNDAYKLHVLEEKHQEAIELCRRALEIEPDNYRVRIFLGMLLGDHGNPEEILESRQHFIGAIKNAEKASVFCTTWPEEAALHHLGIWELRQRHHFGSCLFFLIDYLVCGNESSYRYMVEVLADIEPGLCEDIKIVLARLKDEYQCVLKEP
jgi:tetratricopeptide (TPR) repeat protein